MKELKCKNCIHYPVCKDTVADENWTNDAPIELRKMFSPENCENFTPAADVAPVVHGEWIVQTRSLGYFEPQDTYICSICGREEFRKEPYCNCGARMDGDKSNA